MTCCYICESGNIKRYNKVNDFNILKCKNCNLLWVGDDIDDNIINNFYNENYYNSNDKTGYNDYNESENLHRKNAKSLIKIINKTINIKGKKILDIGCASGFYLDEFRKKGCDVCGIEVSSYAYKYAKEKMNLNVINSEFKPDLFSENYFDIVLLLGTIEHLIDPKSILSQISKIMKDEGLLVITTIDINGLIPIYMLKPPEHLFYFNHNNFIKLLKSAKFRKLVLKSYFVNYYIYDLFFRLSKVIKV